MNIEKIREQFEQAIVKMHMDSGMPEDDAKSFLETGSNGYTSVFTKAAWWAWKASREAVVVELPHGWGDGCINPKTGKPYDASLLNSKLVREAIEAQGLKVKE